MNSRHRAREIALQILYQYDLPIYAPSPIVSHFKAEVLSSELRRHYDHFNVPDTLREFIGQLVAGTLLEKEKMDILLEKHASNWKVARMSAVDRSLLRMACYEMTFHKETPHSVIIDEAIELAKQFGTSESPAFINGILDSIKTDPIQPE